MHFSPLSLTDSVAWAALLAQSFDRTPEAMQQMLFWLHDGYPVIAWGAWDEDKLVAQYACLLVELALPYRADSVKAGMSLNMCVHPDYRGKGLIKQVSQPVYEAIYARGGLAGIGFSNAEGVQVDRKSKGYGYRVLGSMHAVAGWLKPGKNSPGLELTDTLPEDFVSSFRSTINHADIHFSYSAQSLMHRYACHPFRQYRYALWREHEAINGLVVYRQVRLRGLPGVALLAAYGDDLPELLRRWSATMRASNLHLVHTLVSPDTQLLPALREIAV
ncbi:MAG TPA: GNAT family N-acetyltransferase, partial [Phototrophicaceae bacterium]|nr:GNAT family N-acetyltransferase [Phototrophicaceae bacterium]